MPDGVLRVNKESGCIVDEHESGLVASFFAAILLHISIRSYLSGDEDTS